MPNIIDTFGQSRVLEPKGAVPVTAWKIDNRREISKNECRLALTYIHIERDNLQQIRSECAYNDEKVKSKIIDIVNRRGKLHNPFTDSGGQAFGIMEEMGSEFKKMSKYKEGDEILSFMSLTAHPIHINNIKSIDYNYGQIEVAGYGILFMGSPMGTIPDDIKMKYTLVAHDESGSLYNVYEKAKLYDRFLVIGKDILSCMMYVSSIRKARGKDAFISVIMDEDALDEVPEAKFIEEFKRITNSACILDVTDPVNEVRKYLSEEEYFDLTVNCEDLSGAAALAVLLTKENGEIHNTIVNNTNTQSILHAESMGKEINAYDLSHYNRDYDSYINKLLCDIQGDLDRLDKLFDRQNDKLGHLNKRAFQFRDETIEKVGGFKFASSDTEALLTEALNVAKYDCNVIIQGETGTGKEMILELIHKNSERKRMPCIKINCATIQENLAESEFFGYEAGAFTGAQATGKAGYFEMANGGTLFLDEVGALSLSLQSKLLRVLQEGRFYKVGGTTPIDIDVRVICANNIPLRQLIDEGRFREDLYYRLNICTLTVPPLRERLDDIPELANSFLSQYSHRYGEDKSFSPGAITRLMEHDWPGNVRELENLVHRLFINVKGHIITEDAVDAQISESLYEDLVINLQRKIHSAGTLDFNKIIEQQERQLIEYALKKEGSTRKAAEFLNMTQPQLMRKKKKYEVT